jgi:hypothetical protein
MRRRFQRAAHDQVVVERFNSGEALDSRDDEFTSRITAVVD